MEHDRRRDLKETALGIFNGLARSYERTLATATLLQDRRWKRWLLGSARLTRTDLVLDIGCGTCLLEAYMEDIGCSAVGLDLTEPMLRLGQEKRLSCVELLVLGDADRLPFAEDTFDAVVSCYVPKYVDAVSLVREVSRVLKPHGRVVMYDFVRPSGALSPFLAFYVYGLIRIIGAFLKAAGRESAFTFQALPQIVRGAVWDASIVGCFQHNGVTKERLVRFSGGIVAAYAGAKIGSLADIDSSERG